MLKRPLGYLVVAPLTFIVGAAVALTFSVVAALLKLNVEFVRWLMGPVCVIAMMAFVHWARTDKNGVTKIWPR